MSSLWPIALVFVAGLLLLAYTAVAAAAREQHVGCAGAVVGALRRAVEILVFVSYCWLPAVSRSVFETWSCESFGRAHRIEGSS